MRIFCLIEPFLFNVDDHPGGKHPRHTPEVVVSENRSPLYRLLILASCCLGPPSMDVPFVNRLPPELLVAITTFITDQSTIFRLATVCRYWHNVLTETTTLWTSIDCRSTSRTVILLQRSKTSPIDLTVDRASYAPGAIAFVSSHTHRIRSINVILSTRELEAFRYLLHGPAPILKVMRLQGQNENFPPPTLFLPHYSSFFRGHFPTLRTLHLEGYPLDLARSVPMMTNGLTTLVLDNRGNHQLRDLLEYLEHCQKLECLKINLPDLQGIVPSSRIVSLPNLRELQLLRSPFTTLHHLSFPPSTDLTIQSPVRIYAAGYPLPDVWAQDGLHHIFKLRTIKGIKMMFYRHNCVVGLLGPHLTLVVQARANDSNPGSFHSDCLDSFQVLPINDTESFRFIQPPRYQFTGTLRLQSCIGLLSRMPALKEIVLNVSVVPFFTHALGPVAGEILCPKLRELTVIRGTDHGADLSDSLLALSDQRKEHGYPLVCSIGSPDPLNWPKIVGLERVV